VYVVPKGFKRISTSFLLFLALILVNVSIVFASFGFGDQGQEVTDIQKRLVELHYDVGGVDGVFGRGTEGAVKSYQKDNNLDVDGVVGEQTYKTLMNREMPVNRSGNSAAIRTVLRTAYNMRGVPYAFGGTSPYGFDCSGFTQYAFASAGYNLPRMADSQYYAFRKVSSGNLQPGDLVFFSTYAAGASHVGIYVGNGQFIHAGSSTGVTVSGLWDGYWGARYIGAARVI
jgi:cell wall-associated NlpC family hydrolase